MRRYNYRLSSAEIETLIEAMSTLTCELQLERVGLFTPERVNEYAKVVESLEHQRDNWKQFENEIAESVEEGNNVGI